MTTYEVYFDERFRQRPRNTAGVVAEIESQWARVALLRKAAGDDASTEHLAELGRALNRLSEHLRWVERHEEAIELKDEAIGIWNHLGRERAHFLAQLQRAEILGEMGREIEAIDQFEALRKLADSNPKFDVYRDFLLESRGRFHTRWGRRGLGLHDVEMALELRKMRGNAKQIKTTKDLLRRMKGVAPSRSSEP